MTRANYKKLGQFIQQVNERNTDLKVEKLLGVSVQKVFIPSIANTVGTNFKRYKIAKKSQFVYIADTSRRGDKIGLAMLEEYDEALVSQAYTVFEIIDKKELDPEYLMMWFRRSEFDRYARYKSHGSVREIFDWEEMCEVELPIPSIEKQREIVEEYNTVTNRIKLNKQLNQKLEETAQALYKHWFVDFEFPCLPSDYRPHGQVNVNISVEELKNRIARVCTYKRTGGLPISDGRTWYVYLILCDDDSIYKGMCNDLYRRFYEHFTGQGAQHTKKYKPVKVIHWEAYDTKEKAAQREKDLKTGYGRTWISRQIEKAGGIDHIKSGLPAPKTELRTAGKMVYNEELDKDIPKRWSVERFEDVFSKITDGKHGNCLDELNSGYYFISAKDILKYSIDYKNARQITEKDFNETHRRTDLRNGDILITNSGTIGKTHLVKSNELTSKTTFQKSVAILKPFNRNICSYLFSMIQFEIENLKELAGGSTQSNLLLGDLRSFEILLPTLLVIKQFESQVSLFIKKIDNNELQSQKLKELQSLLLTRMTQVELKPQAV